VVPDPPAGSETGSSTGSSSSSGSSSEIGALIFVSDASAEAERLISALRTRGYQVVDVPLGLLVNRVSVQRPALILCDADAPGAVESVERIHRDVPGGHRVDVVFIRDRGSQSAPDLTSIIEREGSGSFDRPVDDAALTRKVEALIGPPTRHEPRPRLSPGGRAPILVAATRAPLSLRTKSRAARSRLMGRRASHRKARPGSARRRYRPRPEQSGQLAAERARAGFEPAVELAPRDEPPMSVAPNANQLPQARLSPELEMLLGSRRAARHAGPRLESRRLLTGFRRRPSSKPFCRTTS